MGGRDGILISLSLMPGNGKESVHSFVPRPLFFVIYAFICLSFTGGWAVFGVGLFCISRALLSIFD